MSGSSQRVVLPTLFALLLMISVLALPSLADSGGAQPAAMSSFLDKLQIHGYLTQAYAEGTFVKGGLSSPSSLEAALGIPEDGTSNYRTLALQFRYEISPKDIMVIQFSSRNLGFSPIGLLEDEIELDWAFYERRITDYTSVKVGRVQIPIGIYNETRDVGTILPFFRPPFTWYGEGSFTSETIDGLLLSNRFFPEADWTLDTDVYLGEWQEFEINPNQVTNQPASVRAKDAYGFQLWLNTPYSGLRFGAGFNSKKLEGGALRPPGVTSPASEHFFFSLDGTFDRWVFRSEWREIESVLFTPLVNIDITTHAYYGQLGYFITDKLQAWLQFERVELSATSPIHLREAHGNFRTDEGISLNYFFQPNIVLKAEYHEVEEEQPFINLVFLPTGPAIDPQTVLADGGSYTIVSLSVSF